jgi:glycosyltransferase involved in cell wall biosynthesis
MATITTVTLTYNEEANIEECLESVRSIATKMIVLDGFSKDCTAEIAKRCGAEVYQKDCGYFDRFQFGMTEVQFDTDWILFIDADERLTEESAREVKSLCYKYAATDTNGIVVNYRVNFMGKELKHGASVLKKLRVFKPGMAFMEDIKLDQHIRLKSGKLVYMKSFLLHKDYKGISAWCKKHVEYAEWAAEDYLLKKSNLEKVETSGLEKSALIKRKLKYSVYYKLPMGLRAWIFYIYRYYLRRGFLDGREGKIYTFIHAYWYRFLVDAMVFEKEK